MVTSRSRGGESGVGGRNRNRLIRHEMPETVRLARDWRRGGRRAEARRDTLTGKDIVTRLTHLCIAALLVLPGVLPAQQAVSMTRLATLDSVAVPMAAPSPDGRWILYRQAEANGSRLWIMARDGSSRAPLTSEGFDDFVPRWFPAGDRIVFASTRPNRNGARHRYAMTLEIDPRTGRAVGGPRQVSTEPVMYAAGSPDGKTVVYTTRDSLLRVKLVPLSGGVARELGAFPGGPRPGSPGPNLDNVGVIFDHTGRHVYTMVPTGRETSPLARLMRLPVAGGRPEVVVEADQPVYILPADPRYVLRVNTPRWPHLGAGTVTVTTLDGREVARVTVPRFVRLTGATLDGWGFSGLMSRGSGELRVANVATGEVRVLARGGHWAEAWTPDGSAVIADVPDGEGHDYLVQTIGLDGRVLRSARLTEPHEDGGWATSVGPYYSYLVPEQWSGPVRLGPRSLHALDTRDGKTRLLARGLVGSDGILGRGGFENDGAQWVVTGLEAGRRVIRALDPATGEARTIRSFAADLPRLGGFRVHGDRVAWIEPRGDSARVMLADGARAAPRVIASVQMGGDNGGVDAMTWSWSGDRMAIITRGILSLLDVPRDPGQPVRRRDAPLALRYCCDYLQWLRDDSGMVGIGREVDGGPVNAYLIPLREGAQPRLIAEVGDTWEMLLSPDGKHIAYKVNGPSTTSIWVASIREAVRDRR